MTADQSRSVPRASEGSIDRDGLWAVYDRYSIPNDVQEERGLSFDDFAAAVLALVRPVEGIVLTPEERGDVIQALHYEAAAIVPDGGDPAIAARMRRLAYRVAVS